MALFFNKKAKGFDPNLTKSYCKIDILIASKKSKDLNIIRFYDLYLIKWYNDQYSYIIKYTF